MSKFPFWMRGQFFDLQVEETTHYENYDYYVFEVYLKTFNGLVYMYGAGGNISPSQWLQGNDTPSNHNFHFDNFVANKEAQ